VPFCLRFGFHDGFRDGAFVGFFFVTLGRQPPGLLRGREFWFRCARRRHDSRAGLRRELWCLRRLHILPLRVAHRRWRLFALGWLVWAKCVALHLGRCWHLHGRFKTLGITRDGELKRLTRWWRFPSRYQRGVVLFGRVPLWNAGIDAHWAAGRRSLSRAGWYERQGERRRGHGEHIVRHRRRTCALACVRGQRRKTRHKTKSLSLFRRRHAWAVQEAAKDATLGCFEKRKKLLFFSAQPRASWTVASSRAVVLESRRTVSSSHPDASTTNALDPHVARRILVRRRTVDQVSPRARNTYLGRIQNADAPRQHRPSDIHRPQEILAWRLQGRPHAQRAGQPCWNATRGSRSPAHLVDLGDTCRADFSKNDWVSILVGRRVLD